MDKFKLITQHSLWFIPLCLLVALAYSFILYKKKASWNKTTNNTLAALRFVLVFFLCVLLLQPLIKHFKNYFEKPTMVLAIDNSQSIKGTTDTSSISKIKNELIGLKESIEESGLSVNIQQLDPGENLTDLKNLKFDVPSTNLSLLLNDIQSNYENRNLAGVILFSDGIYNQGAAPNFNQYNFKIYPVGLGDTVPKKDLSLKGITYNKISYSGNKFPIVAEMHNKGFVGENVNVSLKQNGTILEKKTIKINKESNVQEVDFEISSDKKGLQHYVVEVEKVKGEYTSKNNVAHAYIDIIDGKEKVLLIALSPHPDIKAIKSAIEKKENYELEIFIPGLSELKEEKYDLVIFHQLPDYSNTVKSLVDKYSKAEGSVLYIIGSQTNTADLNLVNGIINIQSRRGQVDNVTAAVNSNFDKFKIETEEKNIFNKFPPVTVPFGNYSLLAGSETEVILYQQIGSTVSSKPLLMVSNKGNKKTGVFAGDGLWEWRLNEFSETKDTKVFDKFFANLIQYLSSKEDKRKFRVFPVSNDFFVSDKIIFEAETYNDIYEKIYGQKINLKITDEKGNATSYAFVNGESNSRFEVKGLRQGVYKYEASAILSGKLERNKGEFSIQELNLEAMNTTADHEILKQLAQQTDGRFFTEKDVNQLAAFLKNNKAQAIIHTNEEFVEIVDLGWVFFLFLFLASLEWFLRKYKGGY